MEGKLLGERYLLQQQLGIGRKTFLALDKLATDITHNSVVVKLLSFGNNFSWQHLKLFTREAETLKKLNHPSIPRYLDYLEIDESDFKGFALVQTYIEAENLEQHLKAGRTFSEAEVTQVAHSLLDTLIYLQSQNPAINHRDIKPSNILLANRSGHQVGDVYLVDFGSVQYLTAQEGSTITVVGTYGYMPPEQFGGRTNPATDLYSLGATLIYLVTGRHPTELPQENLRIQFASFVNLSPAFSDWLCWLTEPSLEQRIATATQALEVLNTREVRQPAFSLIQPSGLKNSVVSKSFPTHIICRKNTEYIEIIIPSPILDYVFLGLGVLMPFLLIFLNSLYVLPITIFMVALTPLILLPTIFKYFSQVRLRVDRSQISLKKELWGFKRNLLPPSRTKNIKSIHKLSLPCGRDANGNIIWLTNKLEIVAGSRRYAPTSFRKLNTKEIDWIAAELSEWLDLPINID